MKYRSPKLSVVLMAVLLIALGTPLFDFAFTSHTSPKFWDIAFGAFGLGLIVGVLDATVLLLVTRWYEGKPLLFGSRELLIFSGLFFALAIGTAASILAANRPEKIQADIPVNYAFHCQSRLLPSTLRFRSQEVSMSYDTTSRFLRMFNDASLANAAIVQGLSNVGAGNMNRDAVVLLRDLSEYSVLYLLFNPVVTPEIQDVMYRGGGGHYLAVPDALIRTDRTPMGSIGGDFKQNSFFGYTVFENAGIGMSLPKGMKVTVEHTEYSISRIRFANEYATVKIGIEVAWHRGAEIALLDEKHFRQSWSHGEESDYTKKIEAERRARYFIGSVILYFDAEFDRLRYGFQEMRAHEVWAKDLLAFLERRFAWGTIDYISPLDATKERWIASSGCGAAPNEDHIAKPAVSK